MKKLTVLFFMIIAFCSCRQETAYRSSFAWKPYSKQAVEDSISQRKPMVIDFSADWCPNCHELDRTVFSLPEIQAKLSRVTALRVDVTDQDDPKVQQMLQDYGLEGVPTVIFLDTHGKEIKDSRIIGLVTPEEFEQALALLNVLK